MKLYLVRHGEAEHRSEGGDRDRKLTLYGRDQSVKLGKFLKDLHPSVILTSTYRRAKETLEIIIDKSHWPKNRYFESLDIRPSGDLDDLLIEINAYKEDSVFIVGHNPQLSSLIYHITGSEHPMGNCSFAQIDLTTKVVEKFYNVEDI